MRGKYSPTVTAAYMADQEWWHKYSREAEEWTQYDPDGFDSYGYNEDDVDRAGNAEYVYYENNNSGYGGDEDYNWAYDKAASEWGFDGVKPVCTRVDTRVPYAWEVTHASGKVEFMSAEEFTNRSFDAAWFKPLYE